MVIERLPDKQKVVGSTPTRATINMTETFVPPHIYTEAEILYNMLLAFLAGVGLTLLAVFHSDS